MGVLQILVRETARTLSRWNAVDLRLCPSQRAVPVPHICLCIDSLDHCRSHHLRLPNYGPDSFNATSCANPKNHATLFSMHNDLVNVFSLMGLIDPKPICRSVESQSSASRSTRHESCWRRPGSKHDLYFCSAPAGDDHSFCPAARRRIVTSPLEAHCAACDVR